MHSESMNMEIYDRTPPQVAPESVHGRSKGVNGHTEGCNTIDILADKGVPFGEPFWSSKIHQ